MNDSGHFYGWDGQPHHFVDCTTRAGTRPTTISDCRKNGWLPSVTTILKCIRDGGLDEWIRMQVAIACVTTPRLQGEGDDAFVERVLARDSVDESTKAADLGTEIHAAIEEHLAGRLYPPQYKTFVDAALRDLQPLGKVVASERVFVHQSGYAGKADCVLHTEGWITVVDFKTAKKLPKKPWPKALLQTAALAMSLGQTGDNRIRTGVLYISTTEPGATKMFLAEQNEATERAFKATFHLWRWINNYDPLSDEALH